MISTVKHKYPMQIAEGNDTQVQIESLIRMIKLN